MKVLLYWDDKRKYKIKGLKTVKQNALEVVRDIRHYNKTKFPWLTGEEKMAGV